MASRIRIGSLQAIEETSFGNTTLPALGNNDYMRVFDVELDLQQEPLEEETLRDAFYQLTKIAGTKRGSSIQFKFRVADENVVLPTANFIIARLLESAWGGRSTITVDNAGGGQITGNTPADQVSFEALDADLTGVAIGDAVVVKDATDSNKQLRWITNVQADTPGVGTKTITVNRALGFTPAASDSIYFGHTLYPTDTVPSSNSMGFRFVGEGTDQAWELYGCRCSEAKVSTADGFLIVEMTWNITDWAKKTGQTVVADAWQFARPIPYLFHNFYVDGTSKDIMADWEFMLGMELEELQSPQGQGRSEFEFGNREVTGKFSPRWLAADFDRFPSTTIELMMNGQEGVNAGNQHWGWFAPAAHYTELPAREEGEQQSYLSIPFRAGTYTNANSSTAPASTDARIAIITSE